MPVSQEDREQLLSFVGELGDDIRFVLSAGRAFMTPERYDEFASAWNDLQEQGVREQIEDAINSGDNDDAIERHGLVGRQLWFKLRLVAEARDEARSRPVRGLLRRLLKRINVVLKSLLAAVGAGEAVNELKETLEIELEVAEP